MRNADGSLSPRLAQSFGNRLVAARARKIVTDKECAYLEEELRGYMDAKGTDKLQLSHYTLIYDREAQAVKIEAANR